MLFAEMGEGPRKPGTRRRLQKDLRKLDLRQPTVDLLAQGNEAGRFIQLVELCDDEFPVLEAQVGVFGK
ncbi:MAG: hypothetical protein R3D03_15225 [Geminicoccaceae bacterium]